MKKICLLLLLSGIFCFTTIAQRTKDNFNDNWNFIIDSVHDYSQIKANEISWRTLNVPHDWSIEFPFDSTSPTGTGGGALRGGMGWYTKEFTVSSSDSSKNISIYFEGVYCRSSVWLNGHLLGYRPNGYISFQYLLSPYLLYNKKNILVVKVNNNQQPNSRWYSGSGIYRNVWLQKTNKTAVANWGTVITSSQVTAASAKINISSSINNFFPGMRLSHIIYDQSGNMVSKTMEGIIVISIDTKRKVNLTSNNTAAGQDDLIEPSLLNDSVLIKNPHLWSIENPYLYKEVTQILDGKNIIDQYETSFGVRSFTFNIDNGFILNGKSVKIRGVCNHQDLGCLGTAFNKRAAERQLQILKSMGCNAIRTTHNPPAPELLDLCDKMGFIVMDEAFDMWEKGKNNLDYHLEFKEWHKRDLQDQILRDRNHPSVFIWSVGNEVGEQWGDSTDNSGQRIVADLVNIVKSLDNTRPTVTANNNISTNSKLLPNEPTSLIGYNYNHDSWNKVFDRWGRKPFIVTESVSALQTRGHYDMPGDSIRRWPVSWDKPFNTGNADLTCSAYENCSTPWGSTHEESLKVFEKHKHISGMFVWTGFDYIGEPTPYPWPARSSYFGIIDLAGFPKDAYYLYQSVWTDKPVLHLLPHWNWNPGQMVDVWAYYSQADEVELFLNGRSVGIKKKEGDDLHVMWRIKYEPGTIKAVSRKNGKIILNEQISTAGKAYKIELTADRNSIDAGGTDLSFVTVKVLDSKGNLVPDAINLIKFTVNGDGNVLAVDNGNQTSMEKFQDNKRMAFNGLCLAVIKAGKTKGAIVINAGSEGLQNAKITIVAK